MPKVKLTITESNCRCGYFRKGQEFIVEDLCPPLCHELWNSIYPAVYALKNGAELDYGECRAKCFDAKCPDGGRVCIHGEVAEVNVAYGEPEDIDSWMRLVRTVKHNFPGLGTEDELKEHEQTVLRFMKEHRALCVKENGSVAGVLLLSKKHNMICCLAVSPEYRRRGIASALLEKALSELDRSRDIMVSTFREDDEKGTAPRALYRKFGFKEGELTIEFGYPNQEFILHPKQ